MLDHFGEFVRGSEVQTATHGRVTVTAGTVGFFLRLEHVRVDALGLIENNVIVEELRATRGQLEHFRGANVGHAGVGARHGRYDVFDDSLRESIRHTLDAKLGRSVRGLVVQPTNVSRIVAVDRHLVAERFFLGPGYDTRIFDAMFGQSRLRCYRAQRIGHLRWIQIERALNARCQTGQYEPRVAFETLRSAVD